jgi:hypothetical protein
MASFGTSCSATEEKPMQTKQEVRLITRGAYDVQALRIMMGNRIVANFKSKLGQEAGETEDDSLDDSAKDILAMLRKSHARITDAVIETSRNIRPDRFVGDELVSTYTEFALISHYVALLKAEQDHFRRLLNVIKDMPIQKMFLNGITGIGPAMAAVIISEIDIHKARHASSIWRLAGLDVAEDGFGRSKRKEHLIEREYTDRDGNTATKMSITFNPFLKSKLIGVLGPSFLKTGSSYSAIYYDYKNRLKSRVSANPELAKHDDYRVRMTPKHIHNCAIRYMVKMFIIDLYSAWRKLEGLPVSKPYAEEKLGLVHGH